MNDFFNEEFLSADEDPIGNDFLREVYYFSMLRCRSQRPRTSGHARILADDSADSLVSARERSGLRHSLRLRGTSFACHTLAPSA